MAQPIHDGEAVNSFELQPDKFRFVYPYLLYNKFVDFSILKREKNASKIMNVLYP